MGVFTPIFFDCYAVTESIKSTVRVSTDILLTLISVELIFVVLMSPKVLITGFEPNDDTVNASELVVASLNENPPKEISRYLDSINFKILLGDTNSLEKAIDESLQTLKPDICIGI